MMAFVTRMHLIRWSEKTQQGRCGRIQAVFFGTCHIPKFCNKTRSENFRTNKNFCYLNVVACQFMCDCPCCANLIKINWTSRNLGGYDLCKQGTIIINYFENKTKQDHERGMIPLFFFPKPQFSLTPKPYYPFTSKIGEMILVIYLSLQTIFLNQIIFLYYLIKFNLK